MQGNRGAVNPGRKGTKAAVHYVLQVPGGRSAQVRLRLCARTQAQPFAGLRQKTFEELEDSLVAMEEVYSQAKETGDRAREQQCRNAVIQAKNHARFAARSPKTSAEKKAQKEEMIQWMLVWLAERSSRSVAS